MMQGSDIEATYEVRVKNNDANLMEAIAQLNGVKSAIMLSYDGNFTA